MRGIEVLMKEGEERREVRGEMRRGNPRYYKPEEGEGAITATPIATAKAAAAT